MHLASAYTAPAGMKVPFNHTRDRDLQKSLYILIWLANKTRDESGIRQWQNYIANAFQSGLLLLAADCATFLQMACILLLHC